MRTMFFALLVLSMTLEAPGPTWAQLGEIRIGVDGMTCVT